VEPTNTRHRGLAGATQDLCLIPVLSKQSPVSPVLNVCVRPASRAKLRFPCCNFRDPPRPPAARGCPCGSLGVAFPTYPEEEDDLFRPCPPHAEQGPPLWQGRDLGRRVFAQARKNRRSVRPSSVPKKRAPPPPYNSRDTHRMNPPREPCLRPHLPPHSYCVLQPEPGSRIQLRVQSAVSLLFSPPPIPLRVPTGVSVRNMRYFPSSNLSASIFQRISR